MSAPRTRGKSAESMALIDAARDILEEIQPCSVRAVCYQLFIRKLIPDMSKNSTKKVGLQLVWARENNLIPWEWIVDESREVESVSTWSKPETIIKAAVDCYRRNNWQDQPRRVEVWAEKGTIRGTLRAVLDKYAVSFRVMHGYASATVVNDIAELSTDSDKPMTAIYVGDYDPSGMHMSEVDLPARLDKYGGDIEVVRVALTPDDTEHLPSFPLESKEKDSRHNWFEHHYGNTCWEVDAMSPNDLRERVTDAIEDLIDMDAWSASEKVESAEIESMGVFFKTFKNTFNGGKQL